MSSSYRELINVFCYEGVPIFLKDLSYASVYLNFYFLMGTIQIFLYLKNSSLLIARQYFSIDCCVFIEHSRMCPRNDDRSFKIYFMVKKCIADI